MKVNIHAPTDKWILQRRGDELRKRLNYVTLNAQNKNDFDINFYINYTLFKEKTKTIDIALFTHIEPAPKETKLFFDNAERADYCVCSAKTCVKKLNEYGIKNVVQILPGFNLDDLKPKLILGFVGRYAKPKHENRKGKKLLDMISLLPFTEVRRTLGKVPKENIPAFYRNLDYTVITSKYEGGPMCLVESLACGIPVIAPSGVGLVPEFDVGVFKYENSNFESLKAVLFKLHNKKLKLAKQIEELTWANYAINHDKIFRKVLSC